MAGEEKLSDKAQQRMDLAEEIATLGEIRMMIRMECCNDLSPESKDTYFDALTAVIDRDAKSLAVGE
jgi:hypothetical protein